MNIYIYTYIHIFVLCLLYVAVFLGALEGLQVICSAGELLEDDPGLAAALQGLHGDAVDDAPKCYQRPSIKL